MRKSIAVVMCLLMMGSMISIPGASEESRYSLPQNPEVGYQDSEPDDPSDLSSSRSIEEDPLGGSWFEDFDVTGTTGKMEDTRLLDDDRVVLVLDPTNWRKQANNPVLTTGQAGKFDEDYIVDPTPIFHDGIFELFYTGKSGTPRSIGLARAFDGSNMSRQNSGDAVLDVGSGGKFDDQQVFSGDVVWDGSKYMLFYAGNTGTDTSRIGLATSTDGIVWTRQNNGDPVFTNGINGKFDDVYVSIPSVIYDGTTFHMWYYGYDGSYQSVGYATSSDGISWSRKNNGNRVFDKGQGGKFDDTAIRRVSVINNSGTYEMFYQGYGGGNSYAIGLATSTDGITWTRQNNGNPVVDKGPSGAWDDTVTTHPGVIRLDDKYLMYYAGWADLSTISLGVAIADKHRTSGSITSELITIPQNMNWDNVALDKREPTNTNIKISVLDGVTDGIIPGFNNKSLSSIDISAISPNDHPTIKLRAHFTTTDNTVSPCIYSWGISWVANQTWRDPFIGEDMNIPTDELLRVNGTYLLDVNFSDWNKDANNPILPLGPGGSWEDAGQTKASVIMNNGVFEMFYAANDGSTTSIGHANSTDGITWTKDSNNPIITNGGAGAWNEDRNYRVNVIKKDSVFYIFLEGLQGFYRAIGMYVSTDLSSWTEIDINPVLLRSPGKFDDSAVGYPSVLNVNGTWYCYYHGGSSGGRWKVGVATSADAFKWNKAANSLVLNIGTSGTWDDYDVMDPTVVFYRGTYHMLYDGTGGASGPRKTGHATSADGKVFKRDGNNPVVNPGPNGAWDDVSISGASLAKNPQGLFNLYYYGYNGIETRLGRAVTNRHPSGALVSEEISIPDNMKWDILSISKEEPSGTNINISVLNASTDGVIPGYGSLTGNLIDLSGIDTKDYPSIKLSASFSGQGTKSPVLQDWAVNWTIAKVLQTSQIPDVSFPEDTLGDDIVDLSQHFDQERYGWQGLTFTIESNSDPVHIEGTVDADGHHLDFTSLVGNWTGTARFIVNATDDYMDLNSNIFNVTVSPVNDPPIWDQVQTQWLEGNTTYEDHLNLTSYVSDIDNDPGDMVFSFVESENEVNLTVNVDQSGLVDLSTTHFFGGYVNVTVAVNDSIDVVNSIFKIHINETTPPPPPPINNPPVINSTPPFSARVGVLYTYNVEAYDPDELDVLNYSLDLYPTGMAIDRPSGSISWTPSDNQVGSHNVVVNVSDGKDFVLQRYLINVTKDPDPENHEPMITSVPTLTATVGIPYTYQVNATDEDIADLLIFLLDTHPIGMTINPLTGLVQWTPVQNQVGKNPIAVNVTDGKSFTIQIFEIVVFGSATNEWPTITSALPSGDVKVNEAFEHTVTANDPDIGDVLTFSLTDSPDGMTIDPTTGVIKWTPDMDDVGTATVTVRVQDLRGGFNEQTFTLKVEKKREPTPTMLESMLPFLLLLIIIVVVIVIIVVMVSRKKDDIPPDIQQEGYDQHPARPPPVVPARTEEVELGEPSGSMEADVAKVLAGTVKEIEDLPTIDDIFLIYRDGRLISHHTRKLRPDVDDEILSGMFTAIKDFIKTSFGEEGDLVNEIRYGDSKILIEHGKFIFLAAVVTGKGTRNMYKNMKVALYNIEIEFGHILEGWSGNIKDLNGAKKWITMLIRGFTIEKIGPLEEPDEDTVASIMAKTEPPHEEVRTKTITIDGEEFTETKILQTLSSLPRGLPSGLWGKDLDDLAEEIMSGEYSKTPDGDPLVKIGRKLYYGDPKDLGTYLQRYKSQSDDKSGDGKKGLSQMVIETEQKGHDDEVSFEQSRKIKKT